MKFSALLNTESTPTVHNFQSKMLMWGWKFHTKIDRAGCYGGTILNYEYSARRC